MSSSFALKTMRSKGKNTMIRQNNSGMAMLAVIIMILVMTTVGVGMYQLVQSSIAVTGGFYHRATTRSVSVASGALVMETIANSITGGTVIKSNLLTQVDSNVLADILGSIGSDIATDTPDSSPDFEYQVGQIRSRVDVDFLQAIPMSGGAIEFGSAYDGIGNGQTLGSGFLISEYVQIVTTDLASGSKSVIRYIADN
jgi:hypothetical protein